MAKPSLFKYLGYAWASPLTALAALYTSVFTLVGWYEWSGVHGDALVWRVSMAKSPRWLRSLWRKWKGHAMGQVVVLKQAPEARHDILVHEQEHVRQCMLLGVFQPILYAFFYVIIKAFARKSDPYYSNPFELEARRVARQLIDVEGIAARVGKRGSTP